MRRDKWTYDEYFIEKSPVVSEGQHFIYTSIPWLDGVYFISDYYTSTNAECYIVNTIDLSVCSNTKENVSTCLCEIFRVGDKWIMVGVFHLNPCF